MATTPGADAPDVVKQREILTAIVTELVRESGEGWEALEYRVKGIGRYREDSLTATDPDGSRRVVSPPMATVAPVRALRDVTASPGFGTWFAATILVDRDLRFGAEFDYENEPSWQTEPGLNEYASEQQKYPRSPECQPEWFRRRLPASS